MGKAILMAVALTALSAVPAQAAVDPQHAVGLVKVGDLDLTSSAGVATFERRVLQQAHRLCDVNGRADLALQIAAADCRDSIVASGQSQLPQLVADARNRGAVQLAAR